jgi:ketosteroid isomerase-like protein
MGAAENIRTIQSVYEAFGRGDVAFIAGCVTDNVDWASDTSSDAAPWYGGHTGPQGVGDFFTAFGGAMDVEDFTPLTFAANDDGDVLTIVRFKTTSKKTGRTAAMQLHHWFRFENDKIAYYRGTEDTAIMAAALAE